MPPRSSDAAGVILAVIRGIHEAEPGASPLAMLVQLRQSLNEQLGPEKAAEVERELGAGVAATVGCLQSLAVLGHGAQRLINLVQGGADGDKEQK